MLNFAEPIFFDVDLWYYICKVLNLMDMLYGGVMGKVKEFLKKVTNKIKHFLLKLLSG